MAARGSGHQQDCAVCTRPFPAPPSHVRSLQRCPDCRASGRARCGDCGQETTVLPHASTYGALCEACRRTRARPCAVCGSPFVTATEGVNRCPDCVARKRARCGGCGEEVHVATSYATRTLCPTCRQRRGEHFPTAERVEVRCRGYTLFGEPIRHAPNCAQTYRYTRAYLQRINSYCEGGHTFISHPCSGAQVAVQGMLAQAKKAGVDHPKRMQTAGQLHKLYKKVGQYRHDQAVAACHAGGKGSASAALVAARQEGRGGGRGESASWGNMVAVWSNNPKQQVGICRWCEKLLLYPTSPGHPPSQFHGPCYQAARRTEAGQAWWRDRFKKQKERTTPDQLITRPTRTGNVRHRDDLTRDFAWAVRYYLGKEESYETIGQAITAHRSTVREGIETIFALLPDPQLANPQLRRYITALQTAKARKQASV